ncbi:MAG: ZIP family metal transporter [Deltaproteobacteria bacterium]|nr:ZIP family metal transporter [Deltaproteobacteria bacterium]
MIETIGYAAPLWISAVAGLITFAAGIFPLMGGLSAGRRLHFLLGLTAGVLLTTAFVDLIPEAMSGGRLTGLIMTIGFLTLYGVEWAVGVHGHGENLAVVEEQGDTHFHRHAPNLPLVAFTALALHRLVDGVTLPAAFQVSESIGFTASGAVLVHQFPDGFVAAVLFLAGGWSRKRTVVAVAALALFTPVGSLIGVVLVGVPDWYPHIVGLAAVTFIFVAVAELMPELHHGPHKPTVGVGLVLGVLIAFGIQWFASP